MFTWWCPGKSKEVVIKSWSVMVLCIDVYTWLVFFSSWKFCQFSSITRMWNFLKALAFIFCNPKPIVQGKFLKVIFIFYLCIFFHFKETSLKFCDSMYYYIYCNLQSYLLWNSVGVTIFWWTVLEESICKWDQYPSSWLWRQDLYSMYQGGNAISLFKNLFWII